MADESDWDVFLAHAGPDLGAALALHDLLAGSVRVFLAHRSLTPGDDWPTATRLAQERALMTVVLVSSHTDAGHYARAEILAAIALARRNPAAHRIVPVHLGSADHESALLGLGLKHALSATGDGGLAAVAGAIVRLVEQMKQSGVEGGRPHPPAGDATAVASPTARSSKRWLIPMLVLIAALAVGGAAAWRHRLYPDAVDVLVSVNAPAALAGQEVRVHVALRQRSFFAIGNGVVEVLFDPTHLAFAEGSPRALNIDRLVGAVNLSEPFVLVANPGVDARTTLRARLETQAGSHLSAPVPIELVSGRGAGRPYLERGGTHAFNLSGDWQIEMGAALGHMSIEQDARNQVRGTYSFQGASSSPPLRVQGFKDGTSFKVVFEGRPEGQARIRIDAVFQRNPKDARFLEMHGCAFTLRRDLSVTEDSPVVAGREGCGQARNYVGWRGDSAAPFWASAQLQP